MSRKGSRQNGTRARIAAAAARLIAEDGIDDFGLAKRKAARQLGVAEQHLMPGNDEIETELEAYRELFQAEDHPQLRRELLGLALEVMRVLQQFNPYLSGPVLKGTAGPYAEIDVQLFPESTKEVEIFLLDRQIQYDSRETRRYSGGRSLPASELRIDWEGALVKLSVFDQRDERVALKTSQAGRVIERAGIAEVAALLEKYRGTGASPA